MQLHFFHVIVPQSHKDKKKKKKTGMKKKCFVHNLFIGNPEDKPAGLWLPSIHFLWTADKLNQSQSLTRSNRYRGAERLGCRLAAGAVALFIPRPPPPPADPEHVSQKLAARVAQSAFIKLRALFLPCHPPKKKKKKLLHFPFQCLDRNPISGGS